MHPRFAVVLASFVVLALAPATSAVPPVAIKIDFGDDTYSYEPPARWACTDSRVAHNEGHWITVACRNNFLSNFVCGTPHVVGVITGKDDVSDQGAVETRCGAAYAQCEIIRFDFCVGTSATFGETDPFFCRVWVEQGTAGYTVCTIL